MFKNAHLRLLVKLCGIQLMGPASEETPESLWVVPGDITPDQLKDSIHFINQAEFSPPTFEDGVLAENQLKRKTAPKKKAAFDDEEEDDVDGFLDDEVLFPAGGPTARRVADEKKKPKKTRKRRKGSDTEEVDDSILEEKARKRREKELEKARKIKSALYVQEGDDEFDSDEDEAFFARERQIAERAKRAAQTAVSEPILPRNKRKSEALLDSDDEDEADELSLARKILSSQEDGADSETDDTPLDLSDGESRKRRKTSVEEDEDMGVDIVSKIAEMQDDDAEETTEVVVARRPRVRGGFVVDSDDDE